MELKNIKISDLNFAEYNPREITEKNFKKLMDSIRAFGFTSPLTVNSHPGRENVIIGGHMRTRAAKELGHNEVPCFIVDLDEHKEKLLNIALNNLKLQGRWDNEKLTELVVNINSEGDDINLSGLEDLQVKCLIEEGTLSPIKVKSDDNEEPEKKKETAVIDCPECGHKFTILEKINKE